MIPDISLTTVDALLDELASHSNYSGESLKKRPKRAKKDILSDLYRSLSPFAAACMTQIILRDLRPILYPPFSSNSTINLQHFNSKAYHQLTIWEVMREWHRDMPSIYRARANLDAAARTVHQLQSKGSTDHIGSVTPVLGLPINIPKCAKGTSIKHALKMLGEPSSIWAETKYDGERCVGIDRRYNVPSAI